jgi:MoaA/NifB/PqqE/SkfB family radical SAM enzyme
MNKDSPLLRITRELEQLAEEGTLDERIAMLNLPGPNLCGKRLEWRVDDDGELRQSCEGCVTQPLGNRAHWLDDETVRGLIDRFAARYETRWVTVTGWGDPFHPVVKPQTLLKVAFAHERGLGSYLFTAGDNLDQATCDFLARTKTDVMLSLYGNPFLDARFFEGKTAYSSGRGRIQDEARIAHSFRRLIASLRQEPLPAGLTRVGMNYVLTKRDLRDQSRVQELKAAANEHGVYFVANLDFKQNPDEKVQERLVSLAQSVNGSRAHSTMVHGHCRMGVGSVTVAYDGTLYACPYLSGEGDGNINLLDEAGLDWIVRGYMADRRFACAYRKTLSAVSLMPAKDS